MTVKGTKVPKGQLHLREHLGEGTILMDFARQRYWFENAKQHAREVLKTLVPEPTDAQVTAILNGDAKLYGDSTKGIRLVEREDVAFKKVAWERRQWLESQYIKLAGREVPADMVTRYAEHVVKRIRRIALNPLVAGMLRPETLIEMEEERVRMHDEIVAAAGFQSREGEEYERFAAELARYVDDMATPPEMG